jgi:hypothetical protein
MELQDELAELILSADLIPVPLSDPIAVRRRMSGACRLLWAVLADGITCYLRYADHPSAARRKLFQEANDWLEATEREDLCSFSGLCGAFQLDPDYLRRRLRDLRAHQTRILLKQAA